MGAAARIGRGAALPSASSDHVPCSAPVVPPLCRRTPPPHTLCLSNVKRRSVIYSSCLYCKSALGRNEVLESFPVGRRLAFDETRGRLWVICGVCRRWNLSPLEQRWEAVEDCERRFRSTPRRVTTENIGFGQLAGGLELIRIGRPLRPEFAAWRYGDQLKRRRERHWIRQGVTGASRVLLVTAGSGLLWVPWMAWDAVSKNRLVARGRDDEGQEISIRRKHIQHFRLLPEGDSGWRARVRHRAGSSVLHGPQAVEMVAKLLPHINMQGASAAQVQEAVKQIEASGGPEGTFTTVAQHLRKWQYHGIIQAPDHRVRTAPLELRLALEMAAHEETETRALEGELAQLEDAWREAEEIAAIADSLLIPRSVTDRIRRWRTGG
jgi:hypothetical protein